MSIQLYLCRRRRFAPRFIALTLLLALIAPLGAHAQDVKQICADRCKPKTQVPPFVEIDANTGAILNGATSFAEGEKVQVITSRMNPYKYDYETQIKSTPLDIAIVSAFLGLVPGADKLSGLFPNQPPAGQPVPAQSAAPPHPDPACDPFKADLDTLSDLSTNLSASTVSAKDQATEIGSSYKEYEKFVLATDKDFLGQASDCERICDLGNDLIPHLTRLTDLSKLKAELEELQKISESLEQKATKFSQDHKTCFVAQISAIRKNVTDTTKAVTAAQSKLQEIEKLKPALELLSQRIDKTLADNDSFSSEHYPYTQGEPTGVQITLFRKNLREDGAKEKQVGQVQLTVGQSRFSLSAGFGFSTIQDVTIVKQGDKFVEDNKSDLRPSLTTMLNAQLGKGPWMRSTWGLSTGLVLTSRDSSTEVEYIVGPNFGLLDNRFFIVLGYHVARVQSLRSKDIPADTTTVPVVKAWKSGAMLAFTYKIR
jgi:hypothetical protein